MFFRKKNPKKNYSQEASSAFNPDLQEAAMRCSICNGEQVAGFKDKASGAFTEVMLIRSPADLEEFRAKYNIQGKIHKFY